jgi:hypothetical protein
MDIKTLNDLASLIESYQKLIKVQNDVIREKEETIVLLKKYVEIQEIEKDLALKDQMMKQLYSPCLN